MRIQVYAVVYCGSQCLVAVKCDAGYFFHKSSGGGVIIPEGEELNGAGNYALPGGRLDVEEGKNAKDGALKEFFEETDIDLAGRYKNFSVTMFEHSAKQAYCGVYFELEPLQFQAVASGAVNNLVVGYEAVQSILKGQFGADQYGLLRTTFQGCPMDNELATIQIWDINDSNEWAEISRWKGSLTLGWYYNILEYFKDNLIE